MARASRVFPHARSPPRPRPPAREDPANRGISGLRTLPRRLPMPLRPNIVWALHWLWCAICLIGTVLAGDGIDYPWYVGQWQRTLAGENPWGAAAEVNAYGPLHNLFAALLPLHYYAPKLLMAALLLGATTLLLRRLLATRGDDPAALGLYLFSWPAHVLVTVYGVIFGFNDIVVSALLIAAVLLRLDGRLLLAGALLGLGALLKLYPLLFVPFFMLGPARLELRPLAGAALVFAGGMLAGWLAWGDAVLVPLNFAADRAPSFLSILVPLQLAGAAWGFAPLVEALTGANMQLLAIVVAAGGLWVWRRGYSFLAGLAIVFLAALLVFKTGHLQFYIAWLALLACLLLSRSAEGDAMVRAALPLVLWLWVFTALACSFGSFFWQNAWPWSLPHLVAGLVALWRMLAVPPAYARRRLLLAW